MKKPPIILLHKDELKSTGADIKSVKEIDTTVHFAHRDDHYMFIIQKSGDFVWELDFNNVVLSGPSLCFIIPGQVHRYVSHQDCEGWLVFADAALIPGRYREIFDTYVHSRQAVVTQNDNTIFNIVPALEKLLRKKPMLFEKTIIKSIIETLAGLIASDVVRFQNSVKMIGGQKYNLVVKFKQLVATETKKLRQVKDYASLLHITPLYLNEVVKEITGFPASYWIHQEILLEAKRMLYYTSLDVKEIAYELGYEDYAYFSRFFKKSTGMTALAFRNTKP